jgi:hypothetical protein
MSRLNDPDNFHGRVAHAAKVIAYARTRILPQTCTAISNLASTEAAAERLADISARKLPEAAQQSRARGKAEFDASFDERHRTDTVAGSDSAGVKTRNVS